MSAQRNWYRLEMPSAPRGHALARDWGQSQFVAYEQPGGDWVVWRQDANGFQTPKATLSDFSLVRTAVDEAVMTYARIREANPKDENAQGQGRSYMRAGVGALIGAAVGILLGGLPGILMHHSALASVGAQVGGVLGAAGGAVLAGAENPLKVATERVPNPDTRKLKAKLLR